MKRVLLVMLTALAAAMVCACVQQQEQQEDTTIAVMTPAPLPTDEPEPEAPPIALVLAGENEYTSIVASTARPLVEEGGYRLLEYYSKDPDAQLEDMYSAIGEGVKCIIIMPIDMDNLQPVLDQCDALKLPAINIMIPVNGFVRMLISPDYQSMGVKAAEIAGALLADGASVLSVETQDVPFVTQLMHDGFYLQSLETDNVTLADSILAGRDTDDAYIKIKKALADNEALNCVFVMDENLAPQAVRAAREAGRDIVVISTGGGSAVQSAIEDGSITASVFTSPYELAQLASKYALMAADGNDAAIPQYAALRIEVIDAQNLPKYRRDGYADVILPPLAEPEPEAESDAAQNENDREQADAETED